EAEIALAVFGKADADALRDDPVARVYVHRLRKRLDEFYLRHGMPSGVRLDIPKGDYRIVCSNPAESAEVVALAAAKMADTEPAQPPGARRKRWGLIAAAFATVLAGGNIAAWAMLTNKPATAEKQLAETNVWSGLANSGRPLLIVVGDYYVFGEYEDRLSLK